MKCIIVLFVYIFRLLLIEVKGCMTTKNIFPAQKPVVYTELFNCLKLGELISIPGLL